MTIQEKVEQASRYLQVVLKLFAPKDTGNLSLNAIRLSQVKPDEWQIIIGGELAPYAIYTNQEWKAERWGGKKNPNQNWITRAINNAKPNMILILSGKITLSEIDKLIIGKQDILQEQLDLLAEEV